MDAFVDTGRIARQNRLRELQLLSAPSKKHINPTSRHVPRRAAASAGAICPPGAGIKRLKPPVALNNTAGQAAKAPDIEPTPTGAVLYIEDNDTNLRLIELAVQRFSQLEFVAARNGVSGLQMARRQSLKLILLDLHLPDIAGVDILKLLKADPLTSAIPVVVISADNMFDHLENLQDAGAYGYIAKPIDLKVFRAMLQEITNPAQDSTS